MSGDEQPWITWVCEALARGCQEADIVEELEIQGHPSAKHFVSEISESSILKWGMEQRSRSDALTLYKQLHRFLDQRAGTALDELYFPIDQKILNRFYRTNQPYVLKGWANRWSAFSKPWSAERFIKEFSAIEVEVTEGRESRRDFDPQAHLLKQKTTLGAFAARVLNVQEPTNDFYLIARNHAFKQTGLYPLLNEIDEELILDPKQRIKQSALWFGPEGTFTPLHHDTCNIMFVQMWGEKRIDLLPPYRFDLFETALNMYATLDLRLKPQLEQRTVILKPGDALFIPIGWWHQVEALSHSTSLAMTHFYQNNQYQWYQPGQA